LDAIPLRVALKWAAIRLEGFCLYLDGASPVVGRWLSDGSPFFGWNGNDAVYWQLKLLNKKGSALRL
jgi:hypothetical protein